METNWEPLPAPVAEPCQVRLCMHDCASMHDRAWCGRQADAHLPDGHAALMRPLCYRVTCVTHAKPRRTSHVHLDVSAEWKHLKASMSPACVRAASCSKPNCVDLLHLAEALAKTVAQGAPSSEMLRQAVHAWTPCMLRVKTW